ncbi:MAG TPA: ABC transporter ATP-binding protein [Ktedonobacteraceae bacterium]|jgi:ABC-2 type transport system ATP-binding protein
MDQSPPLGPTKASDPVVLERVTKTFRAVSAVNNVSLHIQAGEIFGLIGPNGSGKTTLIRLLLGLLRPTSGTLRVLGRSMPDRKAASSLGYMTQASALYGEPSVRENLAFFGALYGLRGRVLQARVQDVIELVDLKERARSPIQTLSGGMRQRVSLACSLVHQPQLLFLDEPTVGIDPELRHTFWHYFAELAQQGVTLVISTHHLDEAARCHRLGLLRFGQLLAVDTPEVLHKQSGAEDLEQAFLYFAQRNITAIN